MVCEAGRKSVLERERRKRIELDAIVNVLLAELEREKNDREVCASVKVGGKTPKNVWWSDEIKAAVKRREGVGS